MADVRKLIELCREKGKKSSMKSFEIVIAGTGGQGLMVAGNILAKEASEKEDKKIKINASKNSLG